MFKLVCVLIFILCFSSSLLAAESAGQIKSRFEIQHDLFNNSTQRLSDLDLQMQSIGGERKSVGLAAIYSLVLPGLGEYYAEGFSSGKYFSIAEGALWLTYAAFDIYGSTVRNDARTYAVNHAGITQAGKPDQFFVDIGNFANTQEFNDTRLRDREPDKLYDSGAGYAWQWDSDASRSEFKQNRLLGENVLNDRKFIVLGIVVNHIASAINAARVAILHNKDMSQMGELQFKAGILGGWSNPHGVVLTVTKGF